MVISPNTLRRPPHPSLAAGFRNGMQHSQQQPRARRVVAALLASLAAFAATACASSGGQWVWADQYAAQAPGSGEYVVGVGDLLAVQVWDNEKISTKARVRSDGRISVPLLNDVAVSGRAPTQISREIEQRLRDSNLVLNPRVSVLVEEVRPVTVSVLGAVTRAGSYELTSGDGVAEALASAGGLTEFAHKDRIFVMRRAPEPQRIRFTFGALTGRSGRAAMFRLRSGDVVVAE